MAVYNTPDATAPTGTTTTTTVANDDAHTRLPLLYKYATELESELEGSRAHPATLLTAAQMGRYNQLLDDARALLPHSVALRDDVEAVTENTRAIDAYHDVRVTIVPTLHNALPTDEYAKTG